MRTRLEGIPGCVRKGNGAVRPGLPGGVAAAGPLRGPALPDAVGVPEFGVYDIIGAGATPI
jgi:hypothetical protein